MALLSHIVNKFKRTRCPASFQQELDLIKHSTDFVPVRFLFEVDPSPHFYELKTDVVKALLFSVVSQCPCRIHNNPSSLARSIIVYSLRFWKDNLY